MALAPGEGRQASRVEGQIRQSPEIELQGTTLETLHNTETFILFYIFYGSTLRINGLLNGAINSGVKFT